MTHEHSLYEAIGGRDAVRAAVDLFYRRVLGDPSLASFFERSPIQRLKAHQAAFLVQALGGPVAYSGRSIHEAHAGRGIGDQEFDRVALHLTETLAELRVPLHLIDQVIGRVAALRPQIVERPATAMGDAAAA